MGSNRFVLVMVSRVLLLALILVGLSVAFVAPGYYGVTLLLILVAALLLIELYHYISKTNRELARFLEAARYGDYSHHFLSMSTGADYQQLSETFRQIMQGFKKSRQDQEEKLRHLKSMTEHIPVPLLSIHPTHHIQLHNNAARRLFGGVTVTRTRDLAEFGEEFYQSIYGLEPGNRKLVNFSYDGIERQLTVMATQIITGNRSEKLVSMQDIQSELEDVQLRAWQDLVRVLTHEIMNSITPVASLAKTTVDLVEDVRLKLETETDRDLILEELDDVRGAVETVGRRSDGLMQFVQSYRSLALQPAPQKQDLAVRDIFQRIGALFSEEWSAKGIEFTTAVEPEGLRLQADPDLLEQLLINLLKNAEQALDACANPRALLVARLNQRGRVLVEVVDNGPGIPDDLTQKIFVPFFTTKREGSGVGLALTRQIMIAHGGSVGVGTSTMGGARFTLIF